MRPLMEAMRDLVMPALVVLALMLVVVAAMAPTDLQIIPHKQDCTEDMSCWNCHTMGNRECGPHKHGYRLEGLK